jgi:MoxR-like ATPase
VPALAHRITLRPEMWLRRVDPSHIVAEVLASTPVPASGALPAHSTPTPRPADPGTGRPVADPYRYTAPPRS